MAESTGRKLPLFERATLFKGIGASARDALMREARWVEVERRGVLFTQGADAGELFLLGAGRVRLVRTGPDGKQITLGYRGAGELAGETGWGGVHTAEARVVERLEALRIPRRRLEAAMVADGRLAVRLVAMLSKRVGDLERRMEALLTRPVESRVADFLVDASRRHGIPDSRGVLIGVKFTHQEIASYVGSTRETVTLVLGDLKRRGLIGTDHRRVIVHESEALERLV